MEDCTIAYQLLTWGKWGWKMDKLKPLKPCPFCGGKAEMLINEYNDSRKEYLVACTECDGMVERWRETEKEAVEQWNRRVSDKEDAKC